MTNTFSLLDFAHQRIADTDGSRYSSLLNHEICDLNMAAKTNDLVANGMFETGYHTDGDYHYSQSDGNANGSNSDSRTTNLLTVAALTIYLPCYEKR